ncbi:MAG: TetR/AcrR family transcriptional regulator [Bacteroidales bacterium]
METQFNELIQKISAIYFRYGIKSITMDDLARELGMSKKTLYQYFSDKEDVVFHVIQHHIESQQCEIKKMLEDKNLNAIDHLLHMSRFITENLKHMNPSVFFDLQKHYPTAWEKLISFKRDHVYEKIMENIQTGIREGLYIKDLNYEIIANLYVDMMEMLSGGNYPEMEKFPHEELFRTLFIYHIRGISNEKGQKHLDKRLKEWK